MADKKKGYGLLILLGIIFLATRKSDDDGPIKQITPDQNKKFPFAANAMTFIATNTTLARQLATEYGIPVDTTLAQSGLESGWGTSELAKNANNYFGIKATGDWPGPVYKGYRQYNSIAESFEDYGKFLSTQSRYKPAFAANTTDPVVFASYIAKEDYAEDPNYLKKITDTIHLVQSIKQ